MTDSPLVRGSRRPAIVVAAYDRPDALERLLGSLGRLRVPEGEPVPLTIGVDDSFDPTVRVAEAFRWPHGPKQVLQRPSRLGLREHILQCGDLTEEYGSIILLEDDLYVSPEMYRFAEAALHAYQGEERIAGISLYAYRLDELSRLAFRPLDDGADTFFMQFPSSWGQLWTASQWQSFRAWEQGAGTTANRRLPLPAAAWNPRTSWKRRFLEYLIASDRFFVYPRHSLTTNCGGAGVHFRRMIIDLTAPLAVGARPWRFAEWGDDAIKYDAWFEPLPVTLRRFWPETVPADVTIDFRGTKDPHHVTSPHLLSSRPSRDPDLTFPFLLQPEALNLHLAGEGRFFSLGAATTFGSMPAKRRRQLTEALNGEIDRKTAAGILADRAIRRALRDRSDWRVEG